MEEQCNQPINAFLDHILAGSPVPKAAVIVPYRDRPEQLALFINHMTLYKPDMLILIVEQASPIEFNRGKLLNAGFITLLPLQLSHVIFHDVDKLPLQVDYSCPDLPTQLCSSEIQPTGYFGGVTSFTVQDFKKVGGFSNDFYSRAEDNELFFRVKGLGMNIHYKPGKFRDLPHPRSGPEFDQVLWIKAQQPRKPDDGLEHCKFQLISSSAAANLMYIKVHLLRDAD